MKQHIFLSFKLLTVLASAFLSLNSCGKNEEDVHYYGKEGKGVFVVDGNSSTLKYGTLIINGASSTPENDVVYLFGFSSYGDRGGSKSNAQKTFDIGTITFHVDQGMTLNPGDEWIISADKYSFELNKYQEEPLSRYYDCFRWPHSDFNDDHVSGNLVVKREGDVYSVRIDNLSVLIGSNNDSQLQFIGVKSGSFSWIGPVDLQIW